MATSSNSTTTTVQPAKGGSFGTAGQVAIFKDSDYPADGLATKHALRRFFTQLNPMMKTLQGFSDGNVGLANLDADYLSVPLGAFQSDWNNLVNITQGVITGNSGAGTTVTTFDGKNSWIAYRKDAWGRVDVWLSVAISGTGSAGSNLPTAYCPPANVNFSTGNGVSGSFIVINSSGAINFSTSGATSFSTVVSYPSATLSPGFSPGVFPVYLKIKTGRTPVACFLAGVKPQTSQDISQVATGTLGLPLACSWTFMGASTPGADGSKINQIRIDSIPGLVTNQAYVLNFLVFYGQTGTSGGA